MEIEAVWSAQGRAGEGEVQDEEMAAGIENAGHFAKSVGP